MAKSLRPDIAGAKRKMRVKFHGAREIERLAEHLWKGETVERMTTGVYGDGTRMGLIVLTGRRLLFIQDGVVYKKSQDFPLDEVTSVQWSSGLLLGAIRIVASGNITEITNVNKDDGKEIVDIVRALIGAPQATLNLTAAVAGQPDPIAQIRQLGELREAGVLSQEEFEAKKAELLRRL